MSKTQLWFDLEGTVIPSWDNLEFFIRMPQVKTLKEEYSPELVGIYSYAIHTNEDVERMRSSDLYEWLTRGHRPGPVLSTMDMARHWASYRYFGHNVQLTMTDVWKLPKEYSFIMSMIGVYGEKEGIRFVLYDDTVGRIPHMKVGDNEFLFIEAKD